MRFKIELLVDIEPDYRKEFLHYSSEELKKFLPEVMGIEVGAVNSDLDYEILESKIEEVK